jgi:hypothetical protein
VAGGQADLIVDSDRIEYHWTFTGTNTGPGGTGDLLHEAGLTVAVEDDNLHPLAVDAAQLRHVATRIVVDVVLRAERLESSRIGCACGADLAIRTCTAPGPSVTDTNRADHASRRRVASPEVSRDSRYFAHGSALGTRARWQVVCWS